MPGVSEDYSGRQSDLEVLQHVTGPQGRYELGISSTSPDQFKVAGIQKAVQRYVSLLLTPAYGRRFGALAENTLLSDIASGNVSNTGYLRHLFVIANAAVLDAMHGSDYNTDLYGDAPADEVISSVSLRSASVDVVTGTISLSLDFETSAGSSFTYIVPITPGKR